MNAARKKRLEHYQRVAGKKVSKVAIEMKDFLLEVYEDDNVTYSEEIIGYMKEELGKDDKEAANMLGNLVRYRTLIREGNRTTKSPGTKYKIDDDVALELKTMEKPKRKKH